MHTNQSRSGVQRRTFLAASGAAGAALAVGVGAQRAAAAAPDVVEGFTAADRDFVLRATRIGAIFPIEFPDFDESGPARARATDARLRDALQRTSAGRARAALATVRSLRGSGFAGKSDRDLLAEFARRGTSGTERNGTLALVALGVATVSDQFDPNSDDAATTWLGVIGQLRKNGGLTRSATLAGVR